MMTSAMTLAANLLPAGLGRGRSLAVGGKPAMWSSVPLVMPPPSSEHGAAIASAARVVGYVTINGRPVLL